MYRTRRALHILSNDTYAGEVEDFLLSNAKEVLVTTENAYF
jgi:hypothetical protein